MSNLVVGTYIVPEVFPELGDVFAPGAKVIHVDLNAYEIAKNHPVDLGIVADPKLTLALLADALESALPDARKKAAAARIEQAARRQGGRAQARAREPTAPDGDAVPIKMSRFMEELARAVAGRRRRLRRGAHQLAGGVALPAAVAAPVSTS